MAITPFAQLLRQRRKAKGLTHKQLRHAMGPYLPAGQTPVAQSTLSSWENGSTLPAQDDSQLRAISLVLGIGEAELTAAHAKSGLRTHENHGAWCDEELAQRTQQFMASIGNVDRLFITLIGPSELPMAESPRLQELWCSNLAAGATYRLLLFLDELQEDELRLIFRSIESLSDILNRGRSQAMPDTLGHIELVPLFLYQDGGQDDSEVLYERLAARLSQKALQFVAIRRPAMTLSPRLRRSINQHWCHYGVVALYDPGTSSEPLANFCGRMKLLDTPHGDPLHGFFWLAKEDVRRLQAVVDALMEAFEDHAVSKDPRPIRHPARGSVNEA
ncbi:MAG: helix-turn-helix transcriptional regulator [Methylococcaceae bacterium]|nr:helix-turn-helix transcriptional regulator [Methylococcaceae bacterium]MCI0734538.1 helix-turn-helix transcriptional regulator [Methylococcaceae bacterium]